MQLGSRAGASVRSDRGRGLATRQWVDPVSRVSGPQVVTTYPLLHRDQSFGWLRTASGGRGAWGLVPLVGAVGVVVTNAALKVGAQARLVGPRDRAKAGF